MDFQAYDSYTKDKRVHRWLPCVNPDHMLRLCNSLHPVRTAQLRTDIADRKTCDHCLRMAQKLRPEEPHA